MPLTLLTKRVQQTTFVAVFVDSSQGKVLSLFFRLNCLQGRCYAMYILAPAVVLF